MNNLGGFDMMVGVTQDAINSGLGLLFTTPLDPTDPGGDTVISHKMELGGLEKKEVTKKGDVLSYVSHRMHAEIGQPFIDLNKADINPTKRDTNNRSVRIFFPINKGFCSFFHAGLGERMEESLEGYRISWIASLDQKNISSVQKGLMHPEAIEAIDAATDGNFSKGTIDASQFSVAALFCLFEATTMTASFMLEMLNEKGEYEQANSDPVYEGIVVSMTQTYGAKDFDGTKTPFILGYGIKQKMHDPRPDALFKPIDFRFSTTPVPSGTPDGLAMLNFCMVTSAHPNPAHVMTNKLAGIIDKTLGLRCKGSTDTSGVMAISGPLFNRAFIADMLLSDSGGIWSVRPNDVSVGNWFPDRAANTRKEEWVYNKAQSSSHRMQRKVTQTLTAKLTSTLASNPNMNFNKDTARTLTVNFTGTMHCVATVWELDGDWVGDWWSDCTYYASVTFAAGDNSGYSDQWRVLEHLSTLDLPAQFNGSRWEMKDGRLTTGHSFGSAWESFRNWVGDLFGAKTWSNMFSGMTISLTKNMRVNTEQFKSKIIMPAGQAFDFRGLDTDDQGTVYSHITYKCVQGGERTWAVMPVSQATLNGSLNLMFKGEKYKGEKYLPRLPTKFTLSGLNVTKIDLPYVLARRQDSGASVLRLYIPIITGTATSGGKTVPIDGYLLSWDTVISRDELQCEVDGSTGREEDGAFNELKKVADLNLIDSDKYKAVVTVRYLNICQRGSRINAASVTLEAPAPIVVVEAAPAPEPKPKPKPKRDDDSDEEEEEKEKQEQERKRKEQEQKQKVPKVPARYRSYIPVEPKSTVANGLEAAIKAWTAPDLQANSLFGSPLKEIRA